MKILHVICDLKSGGAQKLMADLLPKIKDEGHEVDIMLFDGERTYFYEELAKKNIRILNSDAKSVRNPLNLLRLLKIINNYDIVHSHTTTPQLFTSIAGILSKAKLVTTEHSTNNKRRSHGWYRPIEKFVYNRYNKIICISEAAKENLLEWLQKSEKDERFEVVNNGIDLSRFENQINDTNEKEHIISMVSRFSHQKDYATFIKAIPFIEYDCKFYLIGDGPNRLPMMELAKVIGVDDKCSFWGDRKDIPQLVKESYIGVQSSTWEGFGLTAIEFMSAGKPVVASDVPGLKNVVEGAGLLFRVGDEKDLALKINELIENKEYYLKISRLCKERAEQYDIKKMTEEYIKVYRNLVSK